MRRIFVNMALCLGTLLFIGLAEGTARADIMYVGSWVEQPSGQGVVPTVLTIQNKQIESGAVIRKGRSDALLGDAKRGVNSKTIAFSELQRAGITSAFDLRIFLDIVEPGNDNLVTIEGRTSLILTAYRSDGTSVDFFYTGERRDLTVPSSSDGSDPKNKGRAKKTTLSAASSGGPGGGKSDHVFGLTREQAAILQAVIESDPDVRLGLSSTLTNTFGGPEQFFFGALQTQQPAPIPEPATLFLLGTGLAGVATGLRRRRQRKM